MSHRCPDAEEAHEPLAGDDAFEQRLAEIVEKRAAATSQSEARRALWRTHHWPSEYGDRCVRIGGRHWCRRCVALYPLGFLVAALTALGLPPWPAGGDPALVWLLSIPATVAFVGEALGLFRYSPRWQVATTLMASLAFGRALGAELDDRWNPLFWQPVAVFGGVWFWASAMSAFKVKRKSAVVVSGQ